MEINQVQQKKDGYSDLSIVRQLINTFYLHDNNSVDVIESNTYLQSKLYSSQFTKTIFDRNSSKFTSNLLKDEEITFFRNKLDSLHQEIKVVKDHSIANRNMVFEDTFSSKIQLSDLDQNSSSFLELSMKFNELEQRNDNLDKRIDNVEVIMAEVKEKIMWMEKSAMTWQQTIQCYRAQISQKEDELRDMSIKLHQMMIEIEENHSLIHLLHHEYSQPDELSNQPIVFDFDEVKLLIENIKILLSSTKDMLSISIS